MFERYTESARRVLFFARYEASQLGGISILPEHLLLGILRESKGITSRLFADAQISLEHLRAEIETDAALHEKVSTSVEMPFSSETKRVLQFAAEQADRLEHKHIGPEHLLLGILREERCRAARLLDGHGLRLDTVRDQIVQALRRDASEEQTAPEVEDVRYATVEFAVPALLGTQPAPCCFCDAAIESAETTLVLVHSPGGSAEVRQLLYAHTACLRERLSPNVRLSDDAEDR